MMVLRTKAALGSATGHVWRAPGLAELLRVIQSWLARNAQHRALAELDDRLLADVGLVRDQAGRVCRDHAGAGNERGSRR